MDFPVDRASIEAMTLVQARWLYSKEEISLMGIELAILVFDEKGKAARAGRILKALHREGSVEIRNVAVLIRSQDGRITAREVEDVGAKRGALFCAVTGGLIGLLGGPTGAVVGAMGGVAAGRVAVSKIDRGFSDGYLAQFQGGLQPGTSALVTLLARASLEKVAEAVADLKGRLVQQPLTGEAVVELAENGDER